MPSVSKAQQRLMGAMGAEDAAYIAGFIDGEGCIGIAAHNKPGNAGGADRRTPHYRLVVSVTNRDLAVLRWIHERIGGSIFEKRRARSNWAPAFELRVTNRAAVGRLLRSIHPFVKVKRSQAELGLAFLALGLARLTFAARGKTWPRRVQHPEDLQAREDFS